MSSACQLKRQLLFLQNGMGIPDVFEAIVETQHQLVMQPPRLKRCWLIAGMTRILG